MHTYIDTHKMCINNQESKWQLNDSDFNVWPLKSSIIPEGSDSSFKSINMAIIFQLCTYRLNGKEADYVSLLNTNEHIRCIIKF